MPNALDNVIVAAAPDPETYTVSLTWANGEKTVNSFAHLVGKGVFAAFADPAFFMQASVGERGRSLEWPGELDFLCRRPVVRDASSGQFLSSHGRKLIRPRRYRPANFPSEARHISGIAAFD